MKRLFKFRYPKLIILTIAIIFAYLIFRNPNVNYFISNLGAASYLRVFIAGIFFAFGFTAPFAAGFFITLNPSNILLAGLIGGLGALLSDLIIFLFIKMSFKDEFNRLKNTKLIRTINKAIEKNIGKRFQIYTLYALSGILIASPLPDEVGIIMLSGLTRIKTGMLAKISFTLNTIGILILLCL